MAELYLLEPERVGNIDQGKQRLCKRERRSRKTVKLKLVPVRKVRTAGDRKRVHLLC